MSPDNDNKPQSSISEPATTGLTSENAISEPQGRTGTATAVARAPQISEPSDSSAPAEQEAAAPATIAGIPVIGEIGQTEPSSKSIRRDAGAA